MLQDFMRGLHEDPDRHCYGLKQCSVAAERNGIARLLISDNLFRAQSVTERRVRAGN